MKKYVFGMMLAVLSGSCSAADGATITVAKSNGARQCESGHVTVAAMKSQLTDNSIEVRSLACGTDGLTRPAVCGAEAGQLNLYGIAAADLDKARGLGFQPLSDWPEASEVPCPAGELPPLSAANISILGIGPAVDGVAFRKVRRIIGDGVTKGILERFIVQGYGIEGGFGACIQASRFTEQPRFERFVKRLGAVRPNPNSTAYTVEYALACRDTASIQ